MSSHKTWVRCAACGLKIESEFDCVSKTKDEAWQEAFCMAAAQSWLVKKGGYCFCYECRYKGTGDDLVDSIIQEILEEES